MHQAGETSWRLSGVTERRFDGRGGVKVSAFPERIIDLGIRPAQLAIRPGRPEQMRTPVLRAQIRARREVGLPNPLFLLALGNRFTYPLCGVPAALLAAALALRPTRRASLTSALVEGLAVTLLLWGLSIVARALVTSGRMAPLIASALPLVVLVVALFLLLTVPPGTTRRVVERWRLAGAGT
jgi:lipopolysaccharide export system permease protein